MGLDAYLVRRCGFDSRCVHYFLPFYWMHGIFQLVAVVGGYCLFAYDLSILPSKTEPLHLGSRID